MTTSFRGFNMGVVQASNNRRRSWSDSSSKNRRWSPKVNQEGQTDIIDYIEAEQKARHAELSSDLVCLNEENPEVLASAMDNAMEKLFYSKERVA